MPCLLLLGMAAMSLASCNKDSSSTDVKLEQTSATTIPSDFLTFYSRYHSDSLFQISNTQFPLPTRTDSTGRGYWDRDSWRMHRLDYFNEEHYHHDLQAASDRLVIEVHQHKQAPFAIVRHWMKHDGTWRLFHYETKSGALSGRDSTDL